MTAALARLSWLARPLLALSAQVWGAAPSPGPFLPFWSQECRDLCCFAHNCSLRPGVQCAHGDCCAHCLVRAWKGQGEGFGPLGSRLVGLS